MKVFSFKMSLFFDDSKYVGVGVQESVPVVKLPVKNRLSRSNHFMKNLKFEKKINSLFKRVVLNAKVFWLTLKCLKTKSIRTRCQDTENFRRVWKIMQRYFIIVLCISSTQTQNRALFVAVFNTFLLESNIENLVKECESTFMFCYYKTLQIKICTSLFFIPPENVWVVR